MIKAQSKIDAARFDKLYKDTEREGFEVNSLDLQVIATRFHFLSPYVIDKRVVEFGAGSILGKTHMLLSCENYTAVEIHPDTASELSETLGNRFRVLNEDCCATSLPDNCCDTIVAFAMIYYTNFDDLMREAARLLQNGGKIIFCSPNARQPNFKVAPGSVEYLEPKDIEAICANHGVELRIFAAYPFKVSKHNVFNFAKSKCRLLLNLFLVFLKTVSPRIYLSLRALRFGKIQKVTNDLVSVDDFEIPVPFNYDDNEKFRMFYYEGTKLR